MDLREQQWAAARARVRGHGLGEHLEQEEALVLVYFLIAMSDGVAPHDVSLRAVRYRIDDVFLLQQDLAELIPSAGSGPSQGEARADQALVRGEDVASPVSRVGEPSAEAWIRGTWRSLHTVHNRVPVDTATSDELGISRWPRPREIGLNLFERAMLQLRVHLDRLILATSDAPIWSEVEVLRGVHAGRTGRITAAQWQLDHIECSVVGAPASVTVRFDDARNNANVTLSDLRILPVLDWRFAVVPVGEPLPATWSASILLLATDAGEDWQEQAVSVLDEQWIGASGRLIVFNSTAPQSSSAAGDEPWVERALRWADAVILPCAGQLPDRFRGAGREVTDRLILLDLSTSGSPDLRTWAAERDVPVAETAAQAADRALQRIGAGCRRSGGERQIPLCIANTTAYHDWHRALYLARKAVVAARVTWPERDASGTADQWWSMHVTIRHPDLRITDEYLVCHATVHSIVAFRRNAVWTDSEVVLVESDNSISSRNEFRGPKGRLLRLPTHPIGHPEVDSYTQTGTIFADEFGLDLGSDRTSSRIVPDISRSDSSLLSAWRSLGAVMLTQEEVEHIRASGTTRSSMAPIVVCRVADLLANPLCDWATLGVITRAVMPTPLPIYAEPSSVN
ncbi:hypothetical protein [Streptomyces sp. NPDC048638]|uniref:hypothetical protein n=1 Tax=Streptomyces sp. NPDC048638 TaxID=3365580 RepID=UPI0037135CF8